MRLTCYDVQVLKAKASAIDLRKDALHLHPPDHGTEAIVSSIIIASTHRESLQQWASERAVVTAVALSYLSTDVRMADVSACRLQSAAIPRITCMMYLPYRPLYITRGSPHSHGERRLIFIGTAWKLGK